MQINKNKHNYDRFNALIETLNDDNMDRDNPTPHLTRAISDHRRNKNSNPINYKTHEITFVVADQYSELTPVPMDSPINDIDTGMFTSGVSDNIYFLEYSVC